MRRQFPGRTCTYHGVRNVSFSGNFTNELNEWSHMTRTKWNSRINVSVFFTQWLIDSYNWVNKTECRSKQGRLSTLKETDLDFNSGTCDPRVKLNYLQEPLKMFFEIIHSGIIFFCHSIFLVNSFQPSRLIWSANQMTSFYMKLYLVILELKLRNIVPSRHLAEV